MYLLDFCITPTMISVDSFSTTFQNFARDHFLRKYSETLLHYQVVFQWWRDTHISVSHVHSLLRINRWNGVEFEAWEKRADVRFENWDIRAAQNYLQNEVDGYMETKPRAIVSPR